VRAVLRAVSVLVAAAAIGVAAAPVQAAGSFRVAFDPPLSEVHAQGDPDAQEPAPTVTVQALDEGGRALRDAVIDVTVIAPPTGLLPRTDRPLVEGRTLLRTRFLAPDGRHAFRYLWPIRGVYALELRASPAPGAVRPFAAFRETQRFDIAERPGEVRRILVALGLLGACGLVAGYAFAVRSARSRRRGTGGEPARRRWPVRISLGGALVALGVGLAALGERTPGDHRAAHGGAHGSPAGEPPSTVERGGVRLLHDLRPRPPGAIDVTTPVRTTVRLVDATTDRPLPGATLRLQAVEAEGGRTVFEAEGLEPPGGVRWEHTFWDGVTHRVGVEAVRPGASTGAGPAITIPIPVAAVPPPLGAKLHSLAYLMLAVGAGMAAGVLLARRRT
jgi:hypothetical protein